MIRIIKIQIIIYRNLEIYFFSFRCVVNSSETSLKALLAAGIITVRANTGVIVAKVNICYTVVVFSSPEHKVLRVSYCDQSLSVVVRRP